MDFFKIALMTSVPFLLAACGGERSTPLDSSAVSSLSSSSSLNSSSIGSSSIKSSSNSTSSSSRKILKLDFDESGCITEHNADATTEFEAFGAQRQMFSWSCVQDVKRMLSHRKLELTYNYDQALGCYRKNLKEDALLYDGLHVEIEADCSQLAVPVVKPVYAAEIVTFDVTAKQVSSSLVNFSFTFSWKNTGTLPLSQIWTQTKVEYADGSMQGQWFGSNELKNQIYVFPSDIFKSADLQDFSFQSYKVDQLYNMSFTITDYYGATLATVTKQIVAN